MSDEKCTDECPLCRKECEFPVGHYGFHNHPEGLSKIRDDVDADWIVWHTWYRRV